MFGPNSDILRIVFKTLLVNISSDECSINRDSSVIEKLFFELHLPNSKKGSTLCTGLIISWNALDKP